MMKPTETLDGNLGAALDMPDARRAAARAHAAMLSATLQQVAATLPFKADVDDFRRVLSAEALAVRERAS